MISAVIPARLDFGCGHVALVSLPRLKGESAAQRTERVNTEKAGARGRSCDFCGPREAALVEVRPAPDVVSVSASGERNGHVASPASQGAPDAASVPPAERVEAPAPLLTAAPAAPVVTAAPPAPAVTAPPTVALVVPRRRVARRPAPVARKRPVAVARARQQRYEVRFAVETVIRATDLRAALRQLESLGARDVLSMVVTET